MIIGISGKIGSGKDTVADLIQYLVCLEKGTLAAHQKEFEYFRTAPQANMRESGWEVRKFADALKDIVCRLIGCTRAQLEDREFKNKELGPEWDFKVLHGTKRKITLDNANEYPHIPFEKMTPRKMLQLLGTEAGREVIHPNIWVNATFADYLPMAFDAVFDHDMLGKVVDNGEETDTVEYPDWLITDMRFPNELAAVKAKQGLIIRIERPTELRFPDLWNEFQLQGHIDEWDEFLKAKGEFDKVYHASETGLDNERDWDYVIDNDGSMKDLEIKVRAILLSAGIITKLR